MIKKKNLNLTIDSDILKEIKKIALNENTRICKLFEELYLTHTGKIIKGKLDRDKRIKRLTLSIEVDTIKSMKEFCIMNDLKVSDLIVYLFDEEYKLYKVIPAYNRIG